MTKNDTVVVNGIRYDDVTGLPIKEKEEKKLESGAKKVPNKISMRTSSIAKPSNVASKSMHSTTSRSSTLNRKFVKKPKANPGSTPIIKKTSKDFVKGGGAVKSPKVQRTSKAPIVSRNLSTKKYGDIIQNHKNVKLSTTKEKPKVATNATVPTKKTSPTAKVVTQRPAANRAGVTSQRKFSDVRPAAKSVTSRTTFVVKTIRNQNTLRSKGISQNISNKSVKQPLPANEIKELVLKQAVKTAKDQSEKPKIRVKGEGKRRLKLIALLSIFIVITLSVLVYISMPQIALTFSNQKSGISASYPSYIPDGYRMSSLAKLDNNKVTIDYSDNDNKAKYTIYQETSNYNSYALLDNVVKPKANDKYETYTDRGLTIYIWGNVKATWVNRGILYTIEGNANLSTDQIKSIALSF